MTNLQICTAPAAMTVDISSLMTYQQMSEKQFYEFCQHNPDLHIERTAQGEVIVMPPAFSDTGNRNNKISYQLTCWAEQDGTGEVFDSSAGFTLPNGAMRSPDASWIKLDCWNALTDEQKSSFAPICPDFVVELMSPSDSLKETQDKMKEYRDNGARLGWLINRKSRQVEIYRPNQEVEVLESPATVSGEDVLPGFILNLESIW